MDTIMCEKCKENPEDVLVKTLAERLAIPADGKIHLTITQQTQTLPSPLAPYHYKGVRHTLESVPAIADLLTKHGSAEKSIIYFNEKNINAILDQTIQDRPFDTVVYSFEASPQAEDWLKVFDEKLGQKDFIKFLKSREPGEIPDIERLMAQAQKITGNFKVISESTYIDSNNMGIVYKIEDANGKTTDEGKLDLPTKLLITMPLLKESLEFFTIEVDLELTKPVDGRPPYFIMSCPRWTTFWRQAVYVAVDDLRDRLPDYLIIAGNGFDTNR